MHDANIVHQAAMQQGSSEAEEPLVALRELQHAIGLDVDHAAS